MQIEKRDIEQVNELLIKDHKRRFGFLSETVPHVEEVLKRLVDFQVAIPSWALGSGGTRFGRFAGSGEPGSLEEKIEDVGLLHMLNKSSGAISLHIPWDIPNNAAGIKSFGAQLGIRFDAVNSNTFQDQPEQALSYKFGSMQHVDKKVEAASRRPQHRSDTAWC